MILQIVTGIACAFFLWKWAQCSIKKADLETENNRLRIRMREMQEEYQDQIEEFAKHAKIDKNTAASIVRRVRASRV